MTIRDIIKDLRTKGHKVTYYIRKDGGVLIRSIDGKKYTGASGNAVARGIVGETLSERRKTQLKRIKSKAGKKIVNKPIISDTIKKRFKKVQTSWRKKVDVTKTGQPTIAKIRWRLEHEGEASAIRLLEEWERYTKGIAYSEVINALADEVLEYYKSTGEEAFEELANDIKANKDTIRDEWIKPAYDELYKLNSGGDSQDIIYNVRRILRLI